MVLPVTILSYTCKQRRVAQRIRWSMALLLSSAALSTAQVQGATDPHRFRDFEIRVIRPKYLAKSMRFELGAQISAILNHPFIYTYLGSTNLTFHLGEALALEAQGSWGLSADRRAKTSLNQTFNIGTIIHRTQYIATGSVLWTPFYGKFQTFSDRLVYFDFFLSAGGGLTGIDYQFDHCSENRDTSGQPKSLNPQSTSYPSLAAALGQKVFLSKKLAFRWDINYMTFWVQPSDGSCAAGTNTQKAAQNDNTQTKKKETRKENVVLKIGISRFF